MSVEYVDLVDDLAIAFDKAAVLVVRLAKNHPLPDGNKRAAWVELRLFMEINGWPWNPIPTIDAVEQAVLAIASGDWDQDQIAAWLQAHLKPSARRA